VVRPAKLVTITGHEIEGNSLILRAKNVTNRLLKGVTIKVAGLVEELFEQFPRMIGLAKWEQDEEKCLKYEHYSNEITEYQISMENNEGSTATMKYSLQ